MKHFYYKWFFFYSDIAVIPTVTWSRENTNEISSSKQTQSATTDSVWKLPEPISLSLSLSLSLFAHFIFSESEP